MLVKASIELFVQLDHLHSRILNVLNSEYWWISSRDFAL